MPATLEDNGLEDLGRQFREWRKDNPYRHHPKKLWNKVFSLPDTYNLKDIAKEIEFSPSYLRRRIKRKSLPQKSSKEPQFVEIQFETQQSQSLNFPNGHEVKLHLKQGKAISAELSFQGAISDIFPLLSSLFNGEITCSK